MFVKKNHNKEPKETKKDNTHKSRYKYSLMNCETYHEQVLLAIHVLKEEQGIDLYDPNNFPGRYSETNKEDKIDKLFDKLMTKKEEKTEEINNAETEIPNNLLNFFKNNNNGKEKS